MDARVNGKEATDLKTYHLVRNHLDQNASYDGCLFETFGAEAEFVRQQARTKIWTLVECDGESCILAGWHSVNRLGYLVTEESWTDEYEEYESGSDTFQLPKDQAQ
jgi:hypothetical protein